MDKNTHESHSRIKKSSLPFIFHVDIVMNERIYTHWHENTEFLCCFEGAGNVLSDSEEMEMKAGDTIVINSNHIHSIMSDDCVKYYCLIIDNSFFKENGINIDNLIFEDKINDKKIPELMQNICDAYLNTDSEFYIAENRLALSAFMTYISKKYSNKINPSYSRPKSHIAVLNAIDYINNHYNERISIDDISKASGYSKYHFARIFKDATGYTIVDHINATRCEIAKNMLLETNESVSQICIDCGFEYPSYFTKTFKNYYHCLPSQFRKKYAKLK